MIKDISNNLYFIFAPQEPFVKMAAYKIEFGETIKFVRQQSVFENTKETGLIAVLA